MRTLGPSRRLCAVVLAGLAFGPSPAVAAELTPEQQGVAACDAARELHEADLLELARTQYVKALELGYCPEARGKLSDITGAQARAKAAYRLGLEAEEADDAVKARAEYERALDIDAGLTAAATRLDAVAKAEGKPAPDRYQRWGTKADDAFEDLGDAASYAGFFAACAALVLLATLLVLARLPLVRAAGRSFGELARTRPGRADRGAVSGAWLAVWRPAWYRVRSLARWVWGASIRVESYKEGESDNLRRAVQGLIGGTMRVSDGGVDLATGEAGSDALDELASAVKEVPHGKLLAAVVPLVRKVLPRDAFFVRVHELEDEGEQRGVSVALATRRNIVRAADVLWEHEFSAGLRSEDDEEAVRVLAIAAASWADFAMLAHRGRIGVAKATRGTGDWRSHALFRIGVEHQRLGRVDLAQAFFAQALDADETNAPPRFNLGVCDLRRGELDQAVARFSAVCAAMKPKARDAAGFPMREPLWYQASYNVVAARWMREPGLPATGERKRIEALMTELIERLADDRAALEQLDRWSQRRPAREAARERMRLLDHIAGPALVLWAEILAVDELQWAQVVGVVDVGAEGPLPRRAQWPQDPVARALHALRHAASPPISQRTAYNLACLFTRIASLERSSVAAGRALDRALRHVRDAAEVPGIGYWAQRDPSLAVLRKRRPHEFADAVGRRSRDDAELPLAALRLVGADNARALERHGISSATALVAACRLAGGRARVAAEVDVSKDLVERWARLAELMLGLDIPPGHANLLELAHRGTRGSLGSTPDPAQLHALLVDLHVLEGSADPAPTAEETETWTKRAVAMKPEVLPAEPIVAAAAAGTRS